MISHFFQYIILKLFQIILAPFSIQTTAKITGQIAVFIGKFHKSSEIAFMNLKTIYPQMSDSEIHHTIKDVWMHLGMNFGEFMKMNSLSDNEFLDLFENTEMKILQELYDKYGKVILVSGHFGNWELGPKLCNIHNMPFSLVYRHSNNGFVDKAISSIRSKYTTGLFNKGVVGAKNMIKAIKSPENLILCMLIDQKMNNGEKLKFFNHDAMTATAASELSIKYNLPIIIASVRRIRKGESKFSFETSKVILPQETDSKILAQTLNDEIALIINKNKWQWFWVHDRWSFFKNKK
ncbi:MAG: hypothetical protein J0G32_04830 [Alphaproteobacteria bacterium]|nr:hypothetical protein [Alphaproteobacteria bacterium]OJV14063.1 MAG: hypothetical protein BGO27_01065 [Alphaproteobacteria bacterium 33-17]